MTIQDFISTPFDTTAVAWLHRDQCALLTEGSKVVPVFYRTNDGPASIARAAAPIHTDMAWFVSVGDLFQLPTTGRLEFDVEQWHPLFKQSVVENVAATSTVVKLPEPLSNRVKGTTTVGFIAGMQDFVRYQGK